MWRKGNHTVGGNVLVQQLWRTVSDQIRSDRSLSRVRLFATPWIAARQASLSITNSRSSPRLTSIESVMPSSHLILSSPSPPAPNPSQHQSFPMSQLFAWGGQSTAVSALASFLPKKSQGWSPSEWTGWTSLQSKGLSRGRELPHIWGQGRRREEIVHVPKPETRGSSLEELPHDPTSPCPRPGAAAGRTNPTSKSPGCAGAGGPRGAIPRWRWGRAAVRRYP